MANSINFEPTRDWVIFRPHILDQTDSGIIIPDAAKKSMSTNVVKVLAAGPKCEMVKVGDTILVHPESGALVIDLDGVDYACINEFQVVGIIPQ